MMRIVLISSGGITAKGQPQLEAIFLSYSYTVSSRPSSRRTHHRPPARRATQNPPSLYAPTTGTHRQATGGLTGTHSKADIVSQHSSPAVLGSTPDICPHTTADLTPRLPRPAGRLEDSVRDDDAGRKAMILGTAWWPLHWCIGAHLPASRPVWGAS
eukprot:scaffold124603_cov45-Prasinocladus_malaysianus.AAC.1